MNTKELYLRLAEACEHTSAITDLPNKKAGMLASAAVWRRLAGAFRPSEGERSDTRAAKLAVDLNSRSFSAASILPFSGLKN
ncbi:hypothetical protein SAMN02990966_06406 [Rhodospirillales bacterium URHD0017]|nr:hypothetical protein SAMN02990966_06406 [Rhodospirillales bacterium URHD0017]